MVSSRTSEHDEKTRLRAPRMQLEDYRQIINYLEDEQNFKMLFSGRFGEKKTVKRSVAYGIMASHINKLSGSDYNSPQMYQRYRTYKKKFITALRISKDQNALSSKDRSKGIHTLEAKLEKICPFYHRMLKLFGDDPHLYPSTDGISDDFSDGEKLYRSDYSNEDLDTIKVGKSVGPMMTDTVNDDNNEIGSINVRQSAKNAGLDSSESISHHLSGKPMSGRPTSMSEALRRETRLNKRKLNSSLSGSSRLESSSSLSRVFLETSAARREALQEQQQLQREVDHIKLEYEREKESKRLEHETKIQLMKSRCDIIVACIQQQKSTSEISSYLDLLHQQEV